MRGPAVHVAEQSSLGQIVRRIILTAAITAVAFGAPAAAQASSTPRLDRAVQIVQRDARNHPGSRARRVAWATFRYVNRTIDELKAEREARDLNLPLPTTVEETLTRRAGACGNMMAVALAIADRLDVPARPVEVYYTLLDGQPGSHAMVEFRIAGGWRLFDLLSNTVYRARTGRLLSLTQLRAMPLARALRRAEHRWDAGYNEHGPNVYFRYLIDRQAQVTINAHGTITWPSRVAQPNVPNYIGQTTTFGERRSDLRARFTDVTAGQVTVHLISGCVTGTLQAQSGIRSSAPIDKSTLSVTLPVSGPRVTLSIVGDCYVVIQSVQG